MPPRKKRVTQIPVERLQKVQEFVSNGYVIFENVLNDPIIADLRKDVERIHMSESVDQHSPAHLINHIYSRSGRFHILVRKDPVFAFVKQLLGPDITLRFISMRYCEPGTPGQPWHIDYRQHWPIKMPEHPLWMPFPTVVVAYYLDDLTTENGPLWIVPGSQVGPERPENVDEHLPGEVSLMMRVGSAVVFDAKVWHRGGGNFSTIPCRALFLDYSLSWVIRPYKFNGPFIEELKEDADQELLKLLGLNDAY